MKKVRIINRKSLKIRHSGRSSDYITPSFGHGCLYKCSYCYMRRNIKDGLNVAKNTTDILKAIDDHVNTLGIKKMNQTHKEFWSYDISCNEDFALHAKFHEWEKIFDFFKYHSKAMATLATKYVNPDLCNYDANKKVRIRFSLMPQNMSSILEPNTSKIIDRIKAVNAFIDSGYEVHLNFSPVIVYDGWLDDYRDLFNMVNDYVDYKDEVKSEVIFLTHNEKMHEYNIANDIPGEKLLWTPHNQEFKISSYGGKNIRYSHKIKSNYIDQFKELHSEIIPWNTIRYIF